MQLVNTTGNFGDTVLISGSGNQYFDISEVRFGGVSGVASEFQVVNPNLISATVPSFNSLLTTGQRDKWKNNCYPNPLLIISETRGISGFASGASGSPINFTPIPQIEKFTPRTGISGIQVSVKGDGFLGLTGLAIENVSGYSNLTGLSNVVTGHYQLSGTGFGSDSVYLDFSVVNNTGLNFNLPSGNFDGNIRVFGTGVSSKLSFGRVQPNVEITGFWPPIGESGEACVISGKYFFDELMHYATGEFENGDGTHTTGSGFLVSFEGNNATGVFIKITGSGIEDNTMLSGTVPIHASSGPVKILKNIKTISLNESGYYDNTGVYFLQPPEPVITGLRSAGNVTAEVSFIGILETLTDLNSGFANLTGSSSTNSKSGLAIFGPKLITGFYDETNENIPITPEDRGSGFAIETTLEVDLATTSSDVNADVSFLGENLYQSGVTGNTLSGIGKPPIVLYYEPMGPDIYDCLEYFNAGSGHLSGCEQAYLMYYSGHHKFLDITSPDFQPALLKSFITDQAINSGAQGLTGFCTGDDNPKCSGEDVNLILTNFIGPPVDIYSTSLGRPIDPRGGSSAGAGPGQISTAPPNIYGSNVPNPISTTTNGRNAATSNLGGAGAWPYGTGTVVSRPCDPKASASGFFATTSIPENLNSRYSNLSIGNQAHLKKDVIPLTKESYNSSYCSVMIAFPPKPASNVGRPTKAGYERISIVSNPSQSLRQNFNPNQTVIKLNGESTTKFSSSQGSKNSCVDGNGNPLRSPLRGTPIINMGSPTNPGRIEIGGPKPIASPTPGVPNSVGGVPRGNASPSNSAVPGSKIPISMSPPPKTNATSTIGLGLSDAASRGFTPRGNLVSVTGPIIGQQLTPMTIGGNPNVIVISCLAFPNEISTQGNRPQNPVQIPPPTNPIGTAPIPTTTVGINPPPVIATVPVLPPAVVRPIGPTIPPASNYPPKGTPTMPTVPPPITIQTTGVNRITSICD